MMFNPEDRRDDLKNELEVAFEEGTLSECIADLISFGETIDKIKEAAKLSDKITDKDIEGAIAWCNELGIKEQVEDLAAFEEFITDADVETDIDIAELSEAYGVEGVDQDIENFDAEVTTVDEILASMVDNVEESVIDDTIKAIQKYSKTLTGSEDNYDKLIVLSAEDMYDAGIFYDTVDLPGIVIGGSAIKVKVVPELKAVQEDVNGNVFYYVADAKDMNKLIKSLDHVFDDNYGDDYITELEDEDADYGELEQIEEKLNFIDRSNGNEYDLLNKYSCEKCSEDKIARILKFLDVEDPCTLDLDELVVIILDPEVEEIECDDCYRDDSMSTLSDVFTFLNK